MNRDEPKKQKRHCAICMLLDPCQCRRLAVTVIGDPANMTFRVDGLVEPASHKTLPRERQILWMSQLCVNCDALLGNLSTNVPPWL